ncbi:uncharacterized protein [Henckelia pumila]|uniref:uncharacterized protein n=1 Tax=Henckelia pumila TaxID=405737 RepID=UPI003C6DEB89
MGLKNTLTSSMKMFTLISVGVVSLAVGIIMKSAVPISMTGFPVIVLSWLKPPFLYLIINGIILAIAASSRFFDQNQSQVILSKPLVSAVKGEASLPQDLAVLSLQSENIISPVVYDQREESLHEELKVEDINISTHDQLQLEYYPLEKPLVSLRFVHRKPIKSNTPQGASGLKVARPKRQETAENTWRAITEGCHMTLTRHQNHHKKIHDPPKSDTFKSISKFHDPSIYRIRREPSMTRDELNNRVEAFIKKFNEDMRLQRQQSLQQFMEMMNRSA